MNILVVGCKGQLGHDMMRLLPLAGHRVTGVDFPDIDITDAPATAAALTAHNPDAVINTAAFTNVDACETNRAAAWAVNAAGVRNLAAAARATGAILVHFSTDYVFDGTATRPYTEDDAVNPLTEYGKSKRAGECSVIEEMSRFFILRIAWLYGIHGNNFVATIRDLARRKADAGETLMVVNDQSGTPTAARDVCAQTIALLQTEAYGLYHATAEGSATWFDFAQTIVNAAAIPVTLVPCTTAQFPRPAPRPAYSVLENNQLKALGLNRMPAWHDGFAGFLAEERSAGILF